LATVVDERRTIAGVHGLHFTYENGVIAGHVLSDNVAAEVGEGVLEKRDARSGPAEANVQASFGFGGRIGPGEIFGDFLLILLENADAKAALRFQEGKQAGFLINADQDKQWVERDGGEGVRGHAMDLPGSAFRGDDGNAGGKAAHDAAKEIRGERSRGHDGDGGRVTQQRKNQERERVKEKGAPK
jgi:hypothetical protein